MAIIPWVEAGTQGIGGKYFREIRPRQITPGIVSVTRPKSSGVVKYDTRVEGGSFLFSKTKSTSPGHSLILPRAEVNPASPPAASVLGRVVFTVLRLDGTIQVTADKVTRLTIISCLLLEHGWPVTRKLNM